MKVDAQAALFMALGHAAKKTIPEIEDIVPAESLLLSAAYDLAELVPDKVRRASDAAEAYKLFFIFESYLRELIVEVLGKNGAEPWWDKVPKDVQDEVAKLEQTEEIKSWMALGSRDRSALMTLPQLLRTIDQTWKEGFDDVVRDKSLIHEARLLVHLRNTTCHMSTIPTEETGRIKQTMRDWFRVVAQ
jgi:hypothetical protein